MLNRKKTSSGIPFFPNILAFSLTRMIQSEGFVVAVYRPSGSGKTTLSIFCSIT